LTRHTPLYRPNKEEEEGRNDKEAVGETTYTQRVERRKKAETLKRGEQK